MQRLLIVFAALVVAAWLSGCCVSPVAVAPPYEPTPRATPSPDSGDQSRSTATPTPSQTGEGQAPTPTCTAEATWPYEARRAVELAKADLARRLEISVSEILVISVEAVDWPDTSLGCPEPGMMYAQVITPGYLIVLEAAGQTYEYHTDRSDQVVLCQTNGENQPPSPKGIDDSSPWQPVEPIEPDEIYPSPEP